MTEKTRILLTTKGHPYEREAFYDIFDTMPALDWTLVEQPAAQALFTPERAASYDAFVLYDMPGIFFDTAPPEIIPPSPDYQKNFHNLIEQGHGFVFLHHAIAGWQDWEFYAELMGGRFLYTPRNLRGKPCMDSGYRHDVTHEISVLTDHPVTQGVPPSFEMVDELYLYEVFEDDVIPLLKSDYEFQAENFYSAARAACDGKLYDNEGWDHPPASALVGWAREVGKSRIVYLQAGDGPSAYANPHYRKLIENAINWVSDCGR